MAVRSSIAAMFFNFDISLLVGREFLLRDQTLLFEELGKDTFGKVLANEIEDFEIFLCPLLPFLVSTLNFNLRGFSEIRSKSK